MSSDRYMKVVLTVLALGVWALVMKPATQPTPALAQTGGSPGRFKNFEYVTAAIRDDNTAGAKKFDRFLNSGWQIVDLEYVTGDGGQTTGMTVVFGK